MLSLSLKLMREASSLMPSLSISFGVAFLVVTALPSINSFAADSSDASAAAASKSRLLNGSAKDREEVTSSIRLVPPAAPAPKPQPRVLNASTQTRQLNGGAQSHQLNGGAGATPLNGGVHGSPSPALYPVAPTPAPISVFHVPNAGLHEVYHPVLPATVWMPPPQKWNYTMTPKNGVMTWAKGYGSAPVTGAAHVAVQSAVRPASMQTSATPMMQQRMSVSPVGLPNRMDTALVSPSVNGVVRPGVKRPEVGLEASAKSLPVPKAAPPAVALLAEPKLITELHRNEKRSVNWDEWYKRVCRVVYDNWQIDSATPGKASVRVTAWPGRQIEARVLDFTPAQDAVRDVRRETAFRETSLRAINSLARTPVLDFPIQSNRGKIVFDLDMTRAVNGPKGIQIANFHDVEHTTVSTTQTATKGQVATKVGTSRTKIYAKNGAHSSSRFAKTKPAPEPMPVAAVPKPTGIQGTAQSLMDHYVTPSMNAAKSWTSSLLFKQSGSTNSR